MNRVVTVALLLIVLTLNTYSGIAKVMGFYHGNRGAKELSRAELDQAFEMVDKPGPKVLRIRAALTEAKGARVVGKTVTSIIPQLRLLTTLAGVATDTQVFVGKATIEVDITDSLSDERLAAAVDQRSGTKALRALGGQWKDVNNAFDYWASRIRIKLVELRNGDATTG